MDVKQAGLLLIGMAFSAGCLGESDDSCELTGTYTLTDERDPIDPGDCTETDPDDADTIQIFDREDGTVAVKIPGVEGHCTGLINGCSMTIPCELRSDDGELVATFNAEWHVSGNEIDGFSTTSIRPGFHPDHPNGCTINYVDTGVRR